MIVVNYVISEAWNCYSGENYIILRKKTGLSCMKIFDYDYYHEVAFTELYFCTLRDQNSL